MVVASRVDPLFENIARDEPLSANQQVEVFACDDERRQRGASFELHVDGVTHGVSPLVARQAFDDDRDVHVGVLPGLASSPGAEELNEAEATAEARG